jgi:hypothetical protein
MAPIDTVTNKLPLGDDGDPAPEEPKPTPAKDVEVLPARQTEPQQEKPQAGVTRREEFGAVTETASAETASSAVAAQATAEVQARYVMALRRPRDLDVFRQNLLKDCERPGFAILAEYAKPIGGGHVKGPSIRFVENALRRYTNALVETPVTFDAPGTRVVRVKVTDLETNYAQFKDVSVQKAVERREPRPTPSNPLGYISVRKNTNGQNTYLVEATDDEILSRENALISKAMRNVGLKILPADIVEEAMVKCRETRAKADKADPDAARKKLIDAFAAVHVTAADLKTYAGGDLAGLSPSQLDELRAIYTAVKDGEVSWRDVMEAKAKVEESKGSTEKKSRADALVGRLSGGQAASGF